jgi:hypothetical protein
MIEAVEIGVVQIHQRVWYVRRNFSKQLVSAKRPSAHVAVIEARQRVASGETMTKA